MEPATFPTSVAILGPGLLGGSLALALKEGFSGKTHVRLWARRQAALDEAAGAADLLTTNLKEAVSGAGLVILATPVETMAALAAQFADYLEPDAIVTDVGSVKSSLVQSVGAVIAKGAGVYIGSHPMAGSEQTGFKAARADIFRQAVCIITSEENTPQRSLERLQSFWSEIGCRLILMSAEEHDRKVARISHLPHAVAAAVVRAALAPDSAAAQCTGQGFRDATRIAAGDPALWAGILLENRQEVLAALQDVSTQITELVEIIRRMDDGELRRYLDAARSLRQHVPAAR